jgi:peptidyl-prolyl cis-trans isomerase C
MGFTEETLKIQMEKTMARQKLVDIKIMPDVTVTEVEMKAFYDSHPEQFRKPETVRVRHILIQVDNTAGTTQMEKAREKIMMIQGKITSGENFSALAKAYSECPSSTNGGDLGYFERGQMVKSFEDASFSLYPGQVSPIVRSDFGFHLIKAIDRQPEAFYSYEDIKTQVADAIHQQRFEKKMKRYIEKIKSNADVKRYSP